MADLKASVSPPDLTAQQLAQESTKPQDTSKPTEQKDVHVIIEEVAEADDIKEGSVSGDESDEAGPGPGSTLQVTMTSDVPCVHL